MSGVIAMSRKEKKVKKTKDGKPKQNHILV